MVDEIKPIKFLFTIAKFIFCSQLSNCYCIKQTFPSIIFIEGDWIEFRLLFKFFSTFTKLMSKRLSSPLYAAPSRSRLDVNNPEYITLIFIHINFSSQFLTFQILRSSHFRFLGVGLIVKSQFLRNSFVSQCSSFLHTS